MSFRILLIWSVLTTGTFAAVPAGCAGSTSLGTFELQVRPFARGQALPLKSLAAVPGGAHLVWQPVHLPVKYSGTAEVTAVLVPRADGHLLVLEPRPAKTAAEWQLPERPQVIAVIFGPQGLSEGKIKTLVSQNQDLLKELADYAGQSSQVESLVQELADAEQSGGADAVIKGLSSKYGVDPSKLNAKTPSDQQAALLLKTLVPAVNSYDPLAANSAQVQQSGGLAASVAGLFFGNPVALAAGGATLLANLKTDLFPSTEFRTAFAQTSEKDTLALCTKNQAAKSKTRLAYLWAYRVPDLHKPVLSLAATTHLPLGVKSALPLKLGEGATADELARARDWRLTPVSGGASVAIPVHAAAGATLEIDLSHPHLPAGDYKLSATWDWDALPVAGTLHLHPLSDFTHLTFAPGEHDKLVAGHGTVAVKARGADFEFLDKVAIESAGSDAKTQIRFDLPLGKSAGPQDSVALHIDTAKPGACALLLTQTDGADHRVPIEILPPEPKLTNLPIRLHLGEAREPFRLEGTGIDRIQSVTSAAGEIAGGAISLHPKVTRGQRFSLLLKVKGLEKPVEMPDAIEIVGPRPKILSARKSLSGAFDIEIGADELPAGAPAGLVITVDRLDPGARPRLALGCENGGSRQELTLAPNEASGGATLALAGPGVLYASVDPGVVGYAGCRLSATVIAADGRSDPFFLGAVVRLPRLSKFTLTAEKVGDAGYAGILEGSDLDVIQEVGWDGQHAVPVDSIPTPLPGTPDRQTLRVVLPWPAPAPHAPLYVWLRGASEGRKTAVAY